MDESTLPPALTRADLDSQRCAQPGCGCGGVLFVLPGCHPRRANIEASYLDGILTISCAQCGALVVRIAVAS